jgi:anaerobic selenocysteine-containing dehydrogenase
VEAIEMVEIVKTLCQLCNRCCGINAYVEDGKMVRVEGMSEHPASKGGLCPKGLAAVQFEYDPRRIIYPLKRVGARGEGKWEQISWEEAIQITVDRLLQVKEQYGASSIAFYKGQAESWETIWVLIKRFMNVLGSPNYCAHSQLCWVPIMMGQVYTLGGMPMPDIENTNCMLTWGFNPFTSCVANFGRRVLDAKQRGAKLVVIDPRFSSVAAKADISIRPRPGTDGALALGMLNVILEEELYDAYFVNTWTYGFEELRKFVKPFNPQWAANVSNVPAALIEEVARLYATIKPACILVGGNGLDQHTNVVQTSRAIAILEAICGNIDQPGGNVFSIRPTFTDLHLADKRSKEIKEVGQHPLYYQTWSVPGSDMVDTLLTGKPYPLKAMIVMDGDPARSLPNTTRVVEGLKNLDFLVVHEVFMTGAAEIADIILPATSYFESSQVTTYPFNASPSVNMQLFGLRDKVVEPPGECHSDFDFLFELAEKMGYDDFFYWKTVEEVFDEQLKPSDITVKALREHGGIILKSFPFQEVYQKYEKQGFATPTKKVELYSTILEKSGYDPLPTFVEPGESTISRPDLAKEYPLIGNASIKPVLFVHNQYRTVPSLNRIMPGPWVEIHPQKARELGIEDGEIVVIESSRGSIKAKAQFAEDIDPNTVFIPHGWGQPYASGQADNYITPDSPRCPISGSTPNRSFLCRVRKE